MGLLNKKSSLFIKIFTWMTVFLIIIAVLFSIISIRLKSRLLKDEIFVEKKALAETAAIGAQSALLNYNPNFFKTVIREVMSKKDIEYCRIIKTDGTIFMADQRDMWGKKIEDKAIKTQNTVIIDNSSYNKAVVTPVFAGPQHWTLWIGFSTKSLVSARKKMIFTNSCLALIGIILGGLISFFIARQITNPLQKLTQSVRSIDSGNLNTRVDVQSNDEIGKLAASFNNMAESLSKTLISKDYVDNIIKSMGEGLMVIDSEGLIKTVNPAILNLLGYKEKDIIDHTLDNLFEKEKGLDSLFKRKIRKELINGDLPDIDFDTTLITKNGIKIPVIFSGSVIRNKKGEIENIVCVFSNISDIKQAQAKIKQSLKEKEAMLKEIHHRVKNNMQIISSMLRINSRRISNTMALDILNDCQNQIRSMAMIHESLYKSENLAMIDFLNYIQRLATHLFTMYQVSTDRISLRLKIRDIYLDINHAIPCGLILNELISNALKHAFPDGKKGEIRIEMEEIKKGRYFLKLEDNGIGIPKKINFQSPQSFGMQLVKDLVDQIDGTIEISSDKGTKFKIRF